MPAGTWMAPVAAFTSERKISRTRALCGCWFNPSFPQSEGASLIMMAATGAFPEAKLTVAGDEIDWEGVSVCPCTLPLKVALDAPAGADKVRKLHRDGVSKAEIARQLQIGRTSVRRNRTTRSRSRGRRSCR